MTNRVRMLLKLLRIAWTVLCGVVCLTITLLWLRSYWWRDNLTRTGGNNSTISLKSDLGDVQIYRTSPTNNKSAQRWDYWKYEQAPSTAASVRSRPWLRTRFHWRTSQTVPEKFLLWVPHWFLVLITGLTTAIPWINRFPFRFSLRTLLIATTLLALALGVLVYCLK